nr:GNAT family N-acetyltransferase [Enterocloster bolteae]
MWYNGSQKGCGISVIRYATQKDENAIYELLCELEGMSLDKEGFHEAYRDYMKDDKMHCLVAEMDKEVVGVLNLRISTMLCRCGKIGEIVELAVRNGMRSQGIGHGLFQEAYHIAREAGCVRFEVSTNRTRLGAHRFYEREGMERSHYRFIRYFPIEK